MGGRTKPRWGIFVGGPRDGERAVLQPHELGQFWVYADGCTPGTRVPHLYEVTKEKRAGGFHEAASWVVRLIRSLPEEPAPVPRPF